MSVDFEAIETTCVLHAAALPNEKPVDTNLFSLCTIAIHALLYKLSKSWRAADTLSMCNKRLTCTVVHFSPCKYMHNIWTLSAYVYFTV